MASLWMQLHFLSTFRACHSVPCQSGRSVDIFVRKISLSADYWLAQLNITDILEENRSGSYVPHHLLVYS
jgi:hypothetical protein